MGNRIFVRGVPYPPMIEKMTNVARNDELGHEQYIQHVLDCPECKHMIINALNLESSKTFACSYLGSNSCNSFALDRLLRTSTW